MMLLSDQEVRIRWLERDLDYIARATYNLFDQIGQTNQLIQLSQNSPTVGGLTPATGTITGTVHGCFGTTTIVGATVNAIASGVTVASTTSGAGGAFSFTAPTSTDHIQVVDSPRLATYLAPCTVTSGGTTALGSIFMTAAAGYVCFNGCTLPISTTLHLTDPNTTITLTWSATFGTWWGCYTRVGVSGEITLGTCSASPVTTTVVYTLDNAGLLQAWYPTCSGAGVTHKPLQAPTCPATPATPGGGLFGQVSATGTSTVCPPTFSFTGTMVLGIPTVLINGTVTITE